MISREQALFIAKSQVAVIAANMSDEFLVIEELTKEVEEGWVFFYDSKSFVETGDPMAALAGNCPIFVRRSGKVAMLPTGRPWEDSVKQLS